MLDYYSRLSLILLWIELFLLRSTHNVDRCLSQTSILLLKLFHSYPVCVELNLEDFVLLLQDVDAFLKLIARDEWS